jgi:hypothetical protein
MALAIGMSNFFFRAGAGLGVVLRLGGADRWSLLLGDTGAPVLREESGTRSEDESLSKSSSNVACGFRCCFGGKGGDLLREGREELGFLDVLVNMSMEVCFNLEG